MSAPAAAVERADFVSVPVTDMQRSIAFYEQTLGLTRIPGPARGRSSRLETSAST